MNGIEGMSIVNIEMPVFWLVAAVIFGICEALTVGLVTIWFAGGALVALVAALLGASLPVQILLFFLVSIGLLFSTRKLFVKKLRTGTEKTNIDALIGEEAKVISEIKPLEPGIIKLRGQDWTAVCKDQELTVPAGTIVKVIAVVGVKAIVKPQDK